MALLRGLMISRSHQKIWIRCERDKFCIVAAHSDLVHAVVTLADDFASGKKAGRAKQNLRLKVLETRSKEFTRF